MAASETLLAHARQLVALLEDPYPGLLSWRRSVAHACADIGMYSGTLTAADFAPAVGETPSVPVLDPRHPLSILRGPHPDGR